MDDPQFVKSPEGEDLVVLTRKDYDALIEALAEAEEELADIAVADQSLADLAKGKVDLLPAEISAMLLDGHPRLRAIRKWRSLRVGELSLKSGVEEAIINIIENGGPNPSLDQVEKLASALDVPVSWLE